MSETLSSQTPETKLTPAIEQTAATIIDITIDAVPVRDRPAPARSPKNQSRASGEKSLDLLNMYFNEIGKIPLLTKEEEVELAKIIERGAHAKGQIQEGEELSPDAQCAIDAGAAAKEHFIKANLRLVVSIAKRYPPQEGMTLLDLIQEGYFGLERAVEKFDYHRGFKFSTYASTWIRQSIGRAINQRSSIIKIPGDKFSALRATQYAIAHAEGASLTQEEEELQRLTSVNSLDKPIGADGELTLYDFRPSSDQTPEEMALVNATHEIARSLLNDLNPREFMAISLHFGLEDGIGKNFREVGEVLGTTSEAARTLIKRILDRIKRENSELIDSLHSS